MSELASLETELRTLVAGVLPDDVVISEPADLHSLNNHIRVLEVPSTGLRYVARLPREETAAALGIRRDEELAAVAAAAVTGVTPTPLATTASGIIVSPFVTGDPIMTTEGWSVEPLASRVAEALGRLLLTPPPDGLPTTYQRLRRMIDGATAVGAQVPDERDLRAQLDAVERERIGDDRYPPSVAHHDVWGNNVIDDGERLWLIDLEFAGGGDGWYDLATVVHAAGLDDEGTAALLRRVGRTGDADDLRALAHGRWLFHVFEML